MRASCSKVLAFALVVIVVAAFAASAQEISSEPYIWRNVVIGGGGFVTGIITHPRQKDLIYARTDVGGAYRWDSTAKQWIPLTDWIGMADVNLTGIESIAIDPSNANMVYLAAGTYTRGDAAILCSTNQGKTFTRINVPFKLGGNEAGRFNGERLAVDPNDGKILFFGSRRDGLWRSDDGGLNWEKAENFPETKTEVATAADTGANMNRSRRSGPQPVGIICVVFDSASGKKGEPTPTLYAAVSTTETNVFVSRDGGSSWSAVAGQPVGLCPNHAVFAGNGTIYLSYGKEPGPNTMTDGAIWKFDPGQGFWTDITPLKPDATGRFGYGAVAVDPQHPNVVMAATFARWRPGDEIFRSTNGGLTWKPLFAEAKLNYSSAPYTAGQKPHWIGDIEISPGNSDQVMFTTGYGIWRCNDANDADAGRPSHWEFFNHGLEETVPLGLISPPEGAPLLSALGDQDGFRHDDLASSPHHGFGNPHFSNSEGIAFARKKPNLVVRTGTGGDGVQAAISTDGGNRWKPLPNEPPGSEGGSIALSANGETIVWTPRRSAAHYSTNGGATWSVCQNLSSRLTVIADSVNENRFYAYDSATGFVLISTNRAASFARAAGNFPKAEDYPAGFGGGGGFGATLYAVPEREGELWLAFRSGGLWHSGDGGKRFVKLEGVSDAYSLGFGKAAPRESRLALFLAGKIADTRGLFRSDDAGGHWVRVNDEEHQFGWINHVTGDPRIYGRVYFGTAGRGIIYGEPAGDDP